MTEPSWLPSTFTKSLSEDFPSAGDRLLRLVDAAWVASDQDKKFQLLPWQRWVIRAALEVYPEGHPKAGKLRYRQVVISMGRQNGKSVLGAIFGMYGLLMHDPGPVVVSVASNMVQANIIYDRVKHVIENNASLRKRFTKATDTRGIKTAKGGVYKVYASKASALQGVPVSLCLYDEVHITKPEMWSAMLSGAKERPNGLVLGITTAGDDNSLLLKDLYELGRKASAGQADLERFGFFCWEAPEGAEVDDADALLSANPSLACGRGDVEDLQALVRTLPEDDARRYHLNQFVASQSAWLPVSRWYGAAKGGLPEGVRPVFSIDRTPDWTYASITASAKVDGVVYTELVASLVNPTLEGLVKVCVQLKKHYPLCYVMDRYTGGDLEKELKKKRYKTRLISSGPDISNVATTSFALITQGKVSHPGDPLLSYQMPRATRKNVGESWKISRSDSADNIDAVIATCMGIYVANGMKDPGIQVF
ncbi:terminase large subunit [Streptomyces sp. NBC_01571]|uniref:terminase large subunit domain-containing protein n=1 Tax=Streptomyces sp. NBC_01571 TaxID=2975883 RepID=UPI002253F610|nr:terminase large subunit [Streptomyces sp. NBC_01571]MCX4577948.1 terminase large subunit [Streptomyces sp. NBC_01571]